MNNGCLNFFTNEIVSRIYQTDGQTISYWLAYSTEIYIYDVLNYALAPEY